jgi:hypothetical protein
MSSPTPEDLEKMIHQTLRGLPARRAPRSLESRVMAAIAARQALPWWRQSFAHWPVAARAGFLVFTAVLAAAMVGAIFVLTRDVQAAELTGQVTGRFAWFGVASDLARALGGSGRAVWNAIPPVWLYGSLAAIAASYAMLVGIGATAYRAFFARR